MTKYTYEDLIKEGAMQVKSIYWPGDDDAMRSFTNKKHAFAVTELYGEYDLLWIIVIEDGKEIERINVRFLESIEWAE